MDNSTINAMNTAIPGGSIEVVAEQVVLSNHSTITTTSTADFLGSPWPGPITFYTNALSATDSTILANGNSGNGGGAVTIQGLEGSNSFAKAISLSNTEISTTFRSPDPGIGGPIMLQANSIFLNQSTLSSAAGLGTTGGTITLVSRSGLDIQNSTLRVDSSSTAGSVDLQAGKSINVAGTNIGAGGATGGLITMAAPIISLGNSTMAVEGVAAGLIKLTGTKAVSVSGSFLEAPGHLGSGGTVQIDGGTLFMSESTISTLSDFGGSGGFIRLKATKEVTLDSSVLNANGRSFGGGTITVESQKTTLTNSQILSNSVNGPGGTINIKSPRFHQDASSVIDASSQFGTNGTVTINGVVQP
jgi:hypothetical protein